MADRPHPTTLARLEPGRLVRDARVAAGLTQQQLAARLGTKQSVVSRWERGLDVPRVDTLARILDACGLEADVRFRRHDDVDRGQIIHQLTMKPAERLEGVRNITGMVAEARRLEPVGS